MYTAALLLPPSSSSSSSSPPDIVPLKTNPVIVIVGLVLFLSGVQYWYQIQKHDSTVSRWVNSAEQQNLIEKQINLALGVNKNTLSKSTKTKKFKGKMKKQRDDLKAAAEEKLRALQGTGASKATLSKTLLCCFVGYLGGSKAEAKEQ